MKAAPCTSHVNTADAEPVCVQAMIASQGFMLLMWLTRDFNGKPGWSALLPNPTYASDGTVAIVFAIMLFVVRPEGPPIMDWDSIAKCVHRRPHLRTAVLCRN